MTNEQHTHVDLRRILTDRFNESELQTLCFDLQVKYDTLPGSGAADKARELIAYLVRRQQLGRLIEIGQRLRPDVDWPLLSTIQPESSSHASSSVSPTDELLSDLLIKHNSQSLEPQASDSPSQLEEQTTTSAKSKSVRRFPRGGKRLRSRLMVFLCHSSDDKEIVRSIDVQLKSEGFLTWLDENSLIAGQNWKLAIPRAVRNADVIIVCLSRRSVSKEGYVQREIKLALDIEQEKPDEAIFIIPMQIEECLIPDRLSHLHTIAFYRDPDKGFQQLITSLQERLYDLESKDALKQRLPPKNTMKPIPVNIDSEISYKSNSIQYAITSSPKYKRSAQRKHSNSSITRRTIRSPIDQVTTRGSILQRNWVSNLRSNTPLIIIAIVAILAWAYRTSGMSFFLGNAMLIFGLIGLIAMSMPYSGRNMFKRIVIWLNIVYYMVITFMYIVFYQTRGIDIFTVDQYTNTANDPVNFIMLLVAFICLFG